MGLAFCNRFPILIIALTPSVLLSFSVVHIPVPRFRVLTRFPAGARRTARTFPVIRSPSSTTGVASIRRPLPPEFGAPGTGTGGGFGVPSGFFGAGTWSLIAFCPWLASAFTVCAAETCGGLLSNVLVDRIQVPEPSLEGSSGSGLVLSQDGTLFGSGCGSCFFWSGFWSEVERKRTFAKNHGQPPRQRVQLRANQNPC